jgi:hypothetical protein
MLKNSFYRKASEDAAAGRDESRTYSMVPYPRSIVYPGTHIKTSKQTKPSAPKFIAKRMPVGKPVESAAQSCHEEPYAKETTE